MNPTPTPTPTPTITQITSQKDIRDSISSAFKGLSADPNVMTPEAWNEFSAYVCTFIAVLYAASEAEKDKKNTTLSKSDVVTANNKLMGKGKPIGAKLIGALGSAALGFGVSSFFTPVVENNLVS